MEVFLTENAFISIITATVEAFPQETLGVLMGFRKPESILVQHAVPYQIAERGETHVSPDPKRSRRVEKFLHNVTRLETVGDFHSHPSTPILDREGYKLSQPDKESTMVEGLGIVVVVDKDSQSRDWKHTAKGSLLGAVYPFSLRLVSWYKTSDEYYRIAEVHCPFALGLGR
jgi:proteasome lid subunit RPN8/RPN11